MVQGQVFFKGGSWHFFYLIFQGLSLLHLEITLLFAKLCCTFEEKIFYHHNFLKKVHSKLSKTKPENIP